MKIGIIREGKNPPDARVPLTPDQCVEVQQKIAGVEVVVQHAPQRCFADEEYLHRGISVKEDLSGCDVLLGVKEVPEDALIPGKIYFFFSHTIKKQAYNRKLLQAILRLNIQLVDYEVLTDKKGFRLIGFGRYAGLVGAYNGIRAYGMRHQVFALKPAYQCSGLVELFAQLQEIVLPSVKIAVTGDGRVGGGCIEVLKNLKIKELSPGEYLKVDHPEEAVFVQLSPEDYVRRKDGRAFDLKHFFRHPQMYDNAFLPYARSTDMLIAAAYWDPKAPILFTSKEMRCKDFRVRVISDITCDIEGSIPSTKRATSSDEPFYDYNPETEKEEPPFFSADNISVQAVDNLPNELPKDASQDFGRSLIDKVFPALFGDDIDGIIERATIAKEGRLKERFLYLEDFVKGN